MEQRLRSKFTLYAAPVTLHRYHNRQFVIVQVRSLCMGKNGERCLASTLLSLFFGGFRQRAVGENRGMRASAVKRPANRDKYFTVSEFMRSIN